MVTPTRSAPLTALAAPRAPPSLSQVTTPGLDVLDAGANGSVALATWECQGFSNPLTNMQSLLLSQAVATTSSIRHHQSHVALV